MVAELTEPETVSFNPFVSPEIDRYCLVPSARVVALSDTPPNVADPSSFTLKSYALL